MIRIPLRCRLFGHRFHVDSSYYYGIDHCEHCDREFIGGRYPIAHAKVRAVLAARWLAASMAYAMGYFKRCSDCGGRFHRHRDDVEHLPF